MECNDELSRLELHEQEQDKVEVERDGNDHNRRDNSDSNSNNDENGNSLVFAYDHHVRYFSYLLNGCIPSAYQALDTSRVTLLYFCLSALDVLGALDHFVEKDANAVSRIVDWIYAMQLQPNQHTRFEKCGFRGSSYVGVPFDPHYESSKQSCIAEFQFDESHIAMTYTAITSLVILGDDLSRLNKEAIIRAVKCLQRSDGCFNSTFSGCEVGDLRFVFCACVISWILDDWSGVDVDAAVRYIVSCQSYDGGIALAPGAEGHGGSTYCAVASLVLMNRLHDLPDLSGLLKWCICCQGSGYRGRPNKPEDTCYSFWIGATLMLIGGGEFTAPLQNRAFNLKCQHSLIGGFGKYAGEMPDLLHSHYGICGLSIAGLDNLRPLNLALGITTRAAASLPKRYH